MKRKKIRSQRRVGHAETRSVVWSMWLAGLVLAAPFYRIGLELRHREPVLLAKPFSL